MNVNLAVPLVAEFERWVKRVMLLTGEFFILGINFVQLTMQV